MKLTPNDCQPDETAQLDHQTTRDAFLEIRNIAQCSACQAVRKFVLNDSSGNRQMVSCKGCSRAYSGANLRQLIVATRQSTTKRPGKTLTKSTAHTGSSQKEPSSEVFTSFKIANDKLGKENATLRTKYATLLEKFDEADSRAASLKEANTKLCAEVSGLKGQISALTDKVEHLLERFPSMEPENTVGKPKEAVPDTNEPVPASPYPISDDTVTPATPTHPHDQPVDKPQPPPRLPLNWATVVK